MTTDEKGYVDLAAGIVKQAMFDYKKAPKENKESVIEECEQFFLSDWGQWLSDYHGEKIIRICRNAVGIADEEEVI
jgi:hypothetical protein